ncbi:hypothetical protein HD554DRAFT_2179293 [Boletus coccyginus]|nr:hypothetical protein HD554DRAFT_2179293 [Boletus coccyginus]
MSPTSSTLTSRRQSLAVNSDGDLRLMLEATTSSPSMTPTLLMVPPPPTVNLILSVPLRRTKPLPMRALQTPAKKVAINNNPRPMRAQTRESAEYWVTNPGNILTLKFPAVLASSGLSTHIGPYFNMEFSGLDFAALKKAKAQFELGALEDVDDASWYPPEAIECCRCAFETIMSLCGEVEDARNTRVPPQKRPAFKTCWREKDNQWVLTVITDTLFKDVPQAADKTLKIATILGVRQFFALFFYSPRI